MKKLVVAILVIAIIILMLNICVLISCSCRKLKIDYNKSDTAINRVRIDSIELVIKHKDSIINNIKIHEKDMVDKVNALSDSASWELFKRLVSE